MLRARSTSTAKKLVLRFVLDNLDHRKRSIYLQEIINMGKKEDCWRKALLAYFDTPYKSLSLQRYILN
ncbi:MAG: hypothetical protein NVV59_08795 [Chitinophagaceae bacterium]|nr:hypothetical protein [Chitinophagaceae bacterium]